MILLHDCHGSTHGDWREKEPLAFTNLLYYTSVNNSTHGMTRVLNEHECIRAEQRTDIEDIGLDYVWCHINSAPYITVSLQLTSQTVQMTKMYNFFFFNKCCCIILTVTVQEISVLCPLM